MKRKTAKEMRGIIAGFSAYEGTKKSYCAKRKITTHMYDYWVKKLSKEPSPSNGEQFIALQVEPEQLRAFAGIELHYPNGNRLMLPSNTSLSLLQNLIKINC